jgi:outer membrane protein OmpA-like peptidoglycan-associated protein
MLLLACATGLAGCVDTSPRGGGLPVTGALTTDDGAATLDPARADAVVIAAAATANTPSPRLSAQVRAVLGAAMSAGTSVSVVRVQGAPTVLGPDELPLRELGGTSAGNAAIVRGNLALVEQAIAAPPQTDGADYVSALTTAADKARGLGARRPLIVLIGSGLADTGALDLTAPGMLGADPAEVVEALGDVADPDRLAGVDVVLSGIGWTAPPQEPLSDLQRTAVRTLWTEVLTAMGARVFVDPEPFTHAAVATRRTVEPVVLPVATPPAVATPAPVCEPREVVFDQTSSVSFVPDGTAFVDAVAAQTALADLAGLMIADHHVTASVRGTTADAGSPEGQRRLGLQRAQLVVDVLVRSGVPAERFTQVVGVGADFPEYVRPDRDARGVLLPGPAALNRSVRIALTYQC